ncbi:MAG: hypothetical protein VX252_11610 [Myxococcota bacterium]|nr:hypothetical protein [Myxococcota bacterium]
MDSARMSRIAILLFFGLVSALIGLGCSDSNSGGGSGGGSGGTQAACGYACVESTTQRDVVAGTVSPSSASDCQSKMDTLQSKTNYLICADDLVTVSSSGACDQEGEAFLVELDIALAFCTLEGDPDQAACVERVFRNHPRWNFPVNCAVCAGETYAAFLACIDRASPLDEDSLKACIDPWVSDSAACSP